MPKHIVTAGANGFDVKPSPTEIERQTREQRMRDRKLALPTNPTNKQIMEMLMDIAERQSEIYDKLK